VADAGGPSAENNLGLLLKQQGKLEEAVRWLRRAADVGHPGGLYNLGFLLKQQGRLEEAEGWYRRAADAGQPRIEFHLGVLLQDLGRVEEAVGWYRRATDAGDADAADALARLEPSGSGHTRDAGRAQQECPFEDRPAHTPDPPSTPPGTSGRTCRASPARWPAR
jgi:TPR repeat protein